MQGLGFKALATSSAACAATLGKLDGDVTRDEALTHAGLIVSVSALPVAADLENGFGHAPETVAETIRFAAATGLAGGTQIVGRAGFAGGVCRADRHGNADRDLQRQRAAGARSL